MSQVIRDLSRGITLVYPKHNLRGFKIHLIYCSKLTNVEQRWRINESEVKKVFAKDKEVTNIVIDPNHELADTDDSNNAFPKKPIENKFDQLKKGN